MKSPRTCESCLFYCPQSQICGNYDVYADDARATTSLCGEAGEGYLRDDPLMAPWMWLLVAVIAVAAIYGNWKPLARIAVALLEFALAVVA